jgi:transcriptional regulator with XRE-family HTH domain
MGYRDMPRNRTVRAMPTRPDAAEIGRRLRACRERTGLTQEEAGAMIGVKQYNICLYETGRRRPSLSRAIQFVAVCGYPADVLFPEIIESYRQSITRQTA